MSRKTERKEQIKKSLNKEVASMKTAAFYNKREVSGDSTSTLCWIRRGEEAACR